MVLIIGLCGKMGTGKDYIANKFIKPFLTKQGMNCVQLCFADQIKVNVVARHNVEFDDVFIQKNADTRKLLQQEGTENGRDIFGKDIWTKHYDTWVKLFESRGIQAIITTDIRFKNELDYIKSRNGIVIKVVAPRRNQKRLQIESNGDVDNYIQIKDHVSECDLDDVDKEVYDLVVMNDFDDIVDDNVIHAVITNVLY